MRLIRVINKNWTKARRMVHKNYDEYVLYAEYTKKERTLREHFREKCLSQKPWSLMDEKECPETFFVSQVFFLSAFLSQTLLHIKLLAIAITEQHITNLPSSHYYS